MCVQGTIGSSLNCLQLHKKAEKIATLLYERGQLRDGDHVALVYPAGNHMHLSFYLVKKIFSVLYDRTPGPKLTSGLVIILSSG